MRRALALLLAAGLWAYSSLAGAAPPAAPATPPEHRRGEEQTFLTYPEWFLVHSPAEYAQYLHADRAPSAFPYWGHSGQFWQGYAAVTRASSSYPFNAGYHLMVSVIGSSTTVEYALKSMYEGTLGRLSEALRTHGPTPEDRLAARVAQDYVDFIRVLPWYEYDFDQRLHELWSATPALGPDLLRKWERRFALSTEYLAKGLYGRLIKWATQSIYDEPLPVTAVLLDRAPQLAPAGVKGLGSSAAGELVTLPRYEAFMPAAQALARQGIAFREIAGNAGPILVSVWAPDGAIPPGEPARLLLAQPILTQPGKTRWLLVVPVSRLGEQLRAFDAASISLEHIYDF